MFGSNAGRHSCAGGDGWDGTIQELPRHVLLEMTFLHGGLGPHGERLICELFEGSVQAQREYLHLALLLAYYGLDEHSARFVDNAIRGSATQYQAEVIWQTIRLAH